MKTLLILLNLLLLSFVASAQLYTFQNYTHRHGLSMSQINSFEQSEDGYMWLGTDGAALVRFDGQKFKEVTIKGRKKNFHFKHLVSKEDDIYLSLIHI